MAQHEFVPEDQFREKRNEIFREMDTEGHGVINRLVIHHARTGRRDKQACLPMSPSITNDPIDIERNGSDTSQSMEHRCQSSSVLLQYLVLFYFFFGPVTVRQIDQNHW